MLATQANHLVDEGQINKLTIIKVKGYSISPLNGKRYVAIAAVHSVSADSLSPKAL